MSDAQIYCLDTCVLMDWQFRHYPLDVFPGLSRKMDDLLAAGRCRAPKLVAEELDAVGGAALVAWAKARPDLFVATSGLMEKAMVIHGSFTDHSRILPRPPGSEGGA